MYDTITADELWAHLSGGTITTAPPDKVPALETAKATAAAMIAAHLIVTEPSAGQVEANRTAQLRAAAELWRWQQTTTGEYGFADGSDLPVPVFRDVFHTVSPVLAHAGLINPAVVA